MLPARRQAQLRALPDGHVVTAKEVERTLRIGHALRPWTSSSSHARGLTLRRWRMSGRLRHRLRRHHVPARAWRPADQHRPGVGMRRSSPPRNRGEDLGPSIIWEGRRRTATSALQPREAAQDLRGATRPSSSPSPASRTGATTPAAAGRTPSRSSRVRSDKTWRRIPRPSRGAHLEGGRSHRHQACRSRRRADQDRLSALAQPKHVDGTLVVRRRDTVGLDRSGIVTISRRRA